jgi:hypothetical protein
VSRKKSKPVKIPTAAPVPTDQQLRERFIAKCLRLGEHFDEFLKMLVQPVLKGILIGGVIYELEGEFFGKDKLFHHVKDFNKELEKHSRIGQSTRYMFTGLKDREPAILERMKVDPFLGVEKALELPSSKPTGEGTGSRGKDKTKRKTSGKGGKGKDKKAEQDRLASQAYELRQQGKSDEEIEKALYPHGTGTAGYYVNMHEANMEEEKKRLAVSEVKVSEVKEELTAPAPAQPAQPPVSEVKPEADEQRPQAPQPIATTTPVLSSPLERILSHGKGTAADEGRPVPPSLEGLVKLVENYFAELGSRFQIVQAEAGYKVEAVEGTFVLIMPVEEDE